MSVPKLILYSYYEASCPWRVRIALEYKKIDYEIRPVDLYKNGLKSGEQHSPEYLALNPFGTVPTMLTANRETCITESLAMLEYLEEICPNPPLLPKDPISRAKVRSMALHIVAATQPLQAPKVMRYIGEEKNIAWAAHWIKTRFEAFEQILCEVSGKYCFGDNFTFADCCLVPQAYNAYKWFNVDLMKFPNIKRVLDNLMEDEAVTKSHPSEQPDCPPEFSDRRRLH